MNPVLVYSAVDAGITQLVECKLPKLDVASSSLVARSIFFYVDVGRQTCSSYGEDMDTI